MVGGRGRCVRFCLGWLSEVCVSVCRRCVRCFMCLVCLPLRVRPRVCPVPVLRFWGCCVRALETRAALACLQQAVSRRLEQEMPIGD